MAILFLVTLPDPVYWRQSDLDRTTPLLESVKRLERLGPKQNVAAQGWLLLTSLQEAYGRDLSCYSEFSSAAMLTNTQGKGITREAERPEGAIEHLVTSLANLAADNAHKASKPLKDVWIELEAEVPS